MTHTLLLIATTIGTPAADDAPTLPEVLAALADEVSVVELTNAEREKAGLAPLKPNTRLFEAARGHAANMAAQDKLEHELDGKTPSERITAASYRWSRNGENIAWGPPTPKEVVAGWMDSPAHKANILNEEFTEIGVGVARNAKGERYWVQVFGAPRE